MAKSEWMTFLELVERTCGEVERRIHSSDSSTLQDFLFRLQANRTACERIIEATVDVHVDTYVSENIRVNVKRLSNSIQSLIDDVEQQLFSVDSTAYSSSILSEILVNRTGCVGRPRLVINSTQIEYLRSWQFSWTRICYTLCVSRTTLWRRLKEVNFNFQQSRFSSISEDDLEQQVSGIKAQFTNCGERMVMGILRSRGIHVPRHRVRDFIRHIDPINTALRWRALHPRYQYDVPGPNALWHIDGLHKLIRWGFVVHGGIDGYSRLVVFLKCATNNRAETVMSSFLESTRRYGIPSRVRSDYGGENIEVGRFMESMRGRNRGSHIQGSSVHNQRIERLHRDTTRCCLSSFYTVFNFMENEGILDLSNDMDVFCLHYVFLLRLNRTLEEFRLGWNHHGVSTESNQSPYQIWIAGVLRDDYRGYTAVQDIRSPDLTVYGVEAGSLAMGAPDNDANNIVTLLEPNCPLNDEQLQNLTGQIDPLSNSSNFGIDIYLRAINCVARILDPPAQSTS